MTETEAKKILKPADSSYLEFYSNVQDIMLGTDNVRQSIELLKQLFEAYEKENYED